MGNWLIEKVGCLLAHNVINKLAAIVGHCDMLADEALPPEAVARVKKVRELAGSAASLLRTGKCEVHLEKETLALEQGFSSSRKPPYSVCIRADEAMPALVATSRAIR